VGWKNRPEPGRPILTKRLASLDLSSADVMLVSVESTMDIRLSDYRFLLLLTTLAIALLVACSGDVSPGGADGASPANEAAPASMTQG
jgi:hypothetical protein